MQTITLLQKMGFGDLADKLSDSTKLEEIYIELPNEELVNIDIYFLSKPNRTIIRAIENAKSNNSSETVDRQTRT